MRSAMLLAAIPLFMALCSPAFSQTCLDDADKPGTSTREVTMRPLPPGPSFYYRADDFVAFFPPQDVLEFFRRAQRDTRDQSLRRLARLVEADHPIKANQGLFAYVTRDWSLWNPMSYIIIQLIAGGNAALTDLRGTPVARLAVSREQSLQVRSTLVLLDAKPDARILWKYECRTG